METTVERMEDNKVKLTVTVSAAEVKEAVDKAYAEAAKKVRIPGFRKGKAPRPVLDTHLGADYILAEAQEALVTATYPQALSDEDIRPIAAPDTGELDAVVLGEGYTYIAEIEIRPELTLGSTDGIVVTVPPSKSTDREIDAQIEHTRDRFATLETVEKAAGESDFALISFVGTIDGEEYEGSTVDKYLYEMGKGLMPPEFDEVLLGSSAGDEVVAEFSIPESSSDPELIGKQARFEITVHEVKSKVLPELDDEFATTVGGFESFDEYREDIRKTLDASKEAGHAHRVESAARAELAKRAEGEVPDSLVQSRANNMVQEFFQSMEQQGISVEQYMQITGMDVSQIREDIVSEAEGRIRAEMALESLWRTLGTEITEDDLDESIREMAGGDVKAAARMRESLRDQGALPIIKEEIMHRQALHWLMENVEVVEEEPAADESDESSADKE